MKVYKTLLVPIKENQETIDYLFKCNQESARVWNECIRLSKELWKNEQKHIERKYLQDNIKGIFSNIISAKAMQIIIKKYLSAIVGIRQARKRGRKDLKFPYKQKKNFNTIWDSTMIKLNCDKGVVLLQRPKCQNKIIKGKSKANPIKIHVKNIPQNVVQVELVYHGRLELSFNYWIEEDNIQIKSNKTSAIDLGEIHTITSCDNEGNNLIITGRKIRSEQRFRNKELTYLNRRLSKCKKNSRNYKKYRKAIRNLMSKSERKMKNNLKKTTKMYSDYVLTNEIKTVVIGDLGKFNMNLKQRKNRKGHQQRLVQWVHGRIKDQLKYNLEKFGVNIVEISEAFTSQTCPSCGNKHKPTGRNYVCECGFKMHRDVLGTYNILSKYINDGDIKPLDINLRPLKYLRIDC